MIVSVEVLALAAAAAGAVTVIAVLLARRGKTRAKYKKPEVTVKWSALVDQRGLIVEAQGPADAAVAAYIVQAVKVMEELGKLSELRVKVGDLDLEVTPQEDLYRVVAR